MKTILLTYAGLILTGLGVLCLRLDDPGLLLLGVPLMIAGPIVFLEDLKRGIAKAMAEEMDRGKR